MANSHDLVVTRTLNAPREKVWQAWTDPQLVQKWWGPRGVTNPTCEWETKPGGKIHIVMLAGAELGDMKGQEWPMTGEIKEVVAPERLVFTSSAIMNGKPILENLITVTLEDQGNTTVMTVQIVVSNVTPEAAGPLQGMEMGWNQQLDKLTELLG
jgi:uncharacterized protein YndB with AHSA1/START domain